MTLITKNFASCAYDNTTANSFSGGTYGGGVLLKFKTAVGQKGLVMPYGSEGEVVLPHNSAFRIDKISNIGTDYNTKHVVECTYLGEAPKNTSFQKGDVVDYRNWRFVKVDKTKTTDTKEEVPHSMDGTKEDIVMMGEVLDYEEDEQEAPAK